MEITTKGGRLAFEVTAARTVSDSRGKWREPTVHVTGTLTVRGVAYEVDVHYAWLRYSRDVFEDGRETGRITYWQEYDRSYLGGYRRADSGKVPEYRTPTRRTLEGWVTEALEEFPTAYAGLNGTSWRRDSLVKGVERDITREQYAAERLRGEAAKHDATVEALRAELTVHAG